MENEDKSSTDGASIKPVSSLRSHFEKISQPNSRAPEVAVHRPSADTPGYQSEASRDRQFTQQASTRPRSSLLSHQSDNVHGLPAKSPEPPSRPISIPPPPHRHSEKGQKSSYLSEDLVVPNRSLTLHGAVPFLRPQDSLPDVQPSSKATGSIEPLSGDFHLLHPLGQPPFNHVDDAHQKKSRLPGFAMAKSNVEEPPSSFHNKAPSDSVKATTRMLPPPINRADKPTISLKPILGNPKPGLRPASPFIDKEASPFSTPPSSEGSPASPPKASSIGSSPADTTNAPLKSAALVEGIAEAVKVSPRRDARVHGFNQFSLPPDLRERTKPALPIRRHEHSSNETLAKARQTLPSQQSASLPSGEPSAMLGRPPKRLPTPTLVPSTPLHMPHWQDGQGSQRPKSSRGEEPNASNLGASGDDGFPDISNVNRRLPYFQAGAQAIELGFDVKLIDMCGRNVCAVGQEIRIWDVTTGQILLSLSFGERDLKVTAMVFKPGAKAKDEGLQLWLGTNFGDLQELDIPSREVICTKSGAHERREIAKIHRHQNELWTLDDGGQLCVWPGNEEGVPSLQGSHVSHRIPKGHTFSLVVEGCLWLASGKEIRIFRPNANDSSSVLNPESTLSQAHIGPVTCGSVIETQLDRVYFGHADGKVSIYSVVDYLCIGIVNLNVYKINSLVGAGSSLWAAFSIGTICVYDVQAKPWKTKKCWSPHHGYPVLCLSLDRSSLWKAGTLRLGSTGADGVLRFWDGTLQEDWLESDMQHHDTEYCSFRQISALVMTWNAGAATPGHLRHEASESQFFQQLIHQEDLPDLLVFGFQELVDLEDRKLTAKTLFKGNKKKDSAEHDHMSRQYRAWRDFLIQCVDEAASSAGTYHLLHTASMVGLFSCVFVKESQRSRIREVHSGELKRGMGGFHGNKGALVVRFVLNDSSICLINCHLAAGQTQTNNRNSDITAILESEILPGGSSASSGGDTFVCGGDGSMIFDHEICILNGDLNYRIDTMGRDTVIKSINGNNLEKLLQRDQLLVSQRRNPMLPVRSFNEAPIHFAPTYKFDVGSDKYDTSEKRRSPAWCDRILYRGSGRIKQLDYRPHVLRVSDHRPVTGFFNIRTKIVSRPQRALIFAECEKRFHIRKKSLTEAAK